MAWTFFLLTQEAYAPDIHPAMMKLRVIVTIF